MSQPTPDLSGRRVVVGITGASGAPYAQRTVEVLVGLGVQVHLVVSPLGQRLLHDELGMEGLDAAALAGRPGGDVPGNLTVHNFRDVGATIASGSFRHDGMLVTPCSSNTLGAIGSGSAQNLVHRAAYVTLKERRRLVLVHREAPLTMVDLRSMQAVTEMGAVVMPASPGFYLMPRTVQDLVDFVVGRSLDLLGIEHGLNVRWADQKQKVRDGRAERAEARTGSTGPSGEGDG